MHVKPEMQRVHWPIMRWTLLVAAVMLAGCAADDDLMAQAEAARANSLAAAGPDGDLSRLTGTLDMDVRFGDDVIQAAADMDIQLHVGDAFTMLVSMVMEGEGPETFETRFTCTPERLTIVLEGVEETVDEPNTAGTCLDVDHSDPMAFLGAFEGLDEMGLGSLDMIPYATATYDAVVQEGRTLVASYSQVISLQGMALDMKGVARIADGLVQSTETSISGAFSEGGFDVAMDMEMASVYHYGARTLGP